MIRRIRLVSLATGLCLALLAQRQKPPVAVTAPAAAERKAGPATAKRAVEKPQTAVTPAAPAAATVVAGVANLDLGLRMGPPRPMRVPPAEQINLANGLRGSEARHRRRSTRHFLGGAGKSQDRRGCRGRTHRLRIPSRLVGRNTQGVTDD